MQGDGSIHAVAHGGEQGAVDHELGDAVAVGIVFGDVHLVGFGVGELVHVRIADLVEHDALVAEAEEVLDDFGLHFGGDDFDFGAHVVELADDGIVGGSSDGDIREVLLCWHIIILVEMFRHVAVPREIRPHVEAEWLSVRQSHVKAERLGHANISAQARRFWQKV